MEPVQGEQLVYTLLAFVWDHKCSPVAQAMMSGPHARHPVLQPPIQLLLCREQWEERGNGLRTDVLFQPVVAVFSSKAASIEP